MRETNLVRVNDGAALKVWEAGEGIPVLLIHGGMTRDFFYPVAEGLAAGGKIRAVNYGRRGYGQTNAKPIDMAGQVSDALAVLAQLGLGKVHVVGHSLGGAIALQLASMAPERVASLTVLEPTLFPFVPSGAAFNEGSAPMVEAYQKGDKKGAFDIVSGMHSPDFKPLLEEKLPPGAYEMSVEDMDPFFQIDLPALMEWQFGPEPAQNIKMPVLYMFGSKTHPAFKEGSDVVESWASQTETIEIEGGTHLFPLTHTTETVDAIGAFCLRSSQ